MKRYGREIIGKGHPVITGRGLGAAQSLPASVVQTIAQVITQTEGANPSLNNPGNLMYAGQAGATATSSGLAQFDSLADGQAALANQIQIYAGRGDTISQMMATYAPASIPGNNPTAYAGYVADALGVSPDTALTDLGGDTTASPVDTLSTLASQAQSYPAGLDFTDPVTIGVTALVGIGLFLLAERL
jgi:hypothetical protein